MVKTFIRFLILIFILINIKIYSQIDTLQYLKKIETTKGEYIGHPFSKLLNEMRIIHPQKLYTQKGRCSYVTQFWFVSENPYESPYKMDIVWENSPLFKGEKIKEGHYNMSEVENEYKNYKIKRLEIPDGGLYLVLSDGISRELVPYDFIDWSLRESKSDFVNNSFYEILCLMKSGLMKIHKIKNIHTRSKKEAMKTIFTIKNPYNKKKAKIIVAWETPITNDQIRDYKNKNGKSFNDTERNLYVDKIIKDINLLKK